jgi:hypothetical protein
MMNSDVKTLVPSLLEFINSDLFTLENLSTSVKLSTVNTDDARKKCESWMTITEFLPLKFYALLETCPDMIVTEKFDKRFIRAPKAYAFEKYGLTNMWRPIMILNKCPDIKRFGVGNFEYIRCYNITAFSELMSVLIARVQNGE